LTYWPALGEWSASPHAFFNISTCKGLLSIGNWNVCDLKKKNLVLDLLSNTCGRHGLALEKFFSGKMIQFFPVKKFAHRNFSVAEEEFLL